jgi:hypothetical protein
LLAPFLFAGGGAEVRRASLGGAALGRMLPLFELAFELEADLL